MGLMITYQKFVRALAVVLAVLFMANVARVSAWTSAPASPPNNNVPAPLHVGGWQSKAEYLQLNTANTPWGLVINSGQIDLPGGTNPLNWGTYLNTGGRNYFRGTTVLVDSDSQGQAGMTFVWVGAGSPPSSSYKFNVAGNMSADAYFYTSDASQKENIRPLADSLAKVLSLQGVSFTWKESGTESIGLVAQDVEKVFPELVNEDVGTGMKSVQYGNLVAPLIEAIKEQQKEIEALRAEVEVLKAAR